MTLFFGFFEESGGSEEMAVNGSVTPETFQVVAPNDGIEAVRINFLIADANIRIYDFFGGIAALTNGITIKAMDGATELFDFIAGRTIKRNAHFTWLAGVDTPVLDAVGDDVLPVRWTIEKSGESFRLQGGQSIDITISDDLTGLTSFTAMLQGQRT